MKLNESKFIAEIRRLAEDIRDNSNIEQAIHKADGIISICNILDVDLPVTTVLPTDENAKIQTPVELNFGQAKEEQYGGSGQ